MSSLNYDCMEIIISKCDFLTVMRLRYIFNDYHLSDVWVKLLEPCNHIFNSRLSTLDIIEGYDLYTTGYWDRDKCKAYYPYTP